MKKTILGLTLFIFSLALSTMAQAQTATFTFDNVQNPKTCNYYHLTPDLLSNLFIKVNLSTIMDENSAVPQMLKSNDANFLTSVAFSSMGLYKMYSYISSPTIIILNNHPYHMKYLSIQSNDKYQNYMATMSIGNLFGNFCIIHLKQIANN